MNDRLVVHEIYLSVQGESTFSGLPCVFIRLTACNLRCSYCDTAYAFSGGHPMTSAAVRSRVDQLASAYQHPAPLGRLPIVEVTGGEPLLQPACLDLLRALCDDGYTVLLETNGACDIEPVDARVHRIVDLKCPSSGETARNRWENLAHLRLSDQLKFVIATLEDYEWTKKTLQDHPLSERCPILFSWASPLTPEQQDPSLKPIPPSHTPLSRQELVERIVADRLPVRFQLQLHKFIWPPHQRGV